MNLYKRNYHMIGFIVQKYSDAVGLLGNVSGLKQHSIASKAVFEGKLGYQKIVLAISGKGKVNAAMTTQMLLDNFPKVKLVINFGLISAINKKLIMGNPYIVRRVIQTDYNTSDRDDTLGLMEEYETSLPLIANKYTELIKDESVGINVATQDANIKKDDIKALEKLEVDAIDMEVGSIMQVCKLNRIPAISFKSINNYAYGEEPNNQKYANIALSHLLTTIENLLDLI